MRRRREKEEMEREREEIFQEEKSVGDHTGDEILADGKSGWGDVLSWQRWRCI